MLDVALTIAFILLPVVTWWVSRSITFTAIGLILGFGIAGNVVQSTIAWGAEWNVRGLQGLALVVMAIVFAGAWRARDRFNDLRTQLICIAIPIAVIGLFLITMRVLAPEDPGVLTGLGYLVSHPMGEDNAKFLHLAAQLADGRAIAFNGYAAGPLLVFMSVIAAGVSVLSMMLLGGVNEVAVVLNTVIGAQHLMMILAPVAFAPLVQRWPGTRIPSVPAPLVWTGMLIIVAVNALLTEYGHLSLQFVVILLVLWALTYIADAPRWAKLGVTLSIATTASVWLPLNVLGLVLTGVAIAWALRRRWWPGAALGLLVLVVCWDALITSLLFLFGITIGTPTGDVSSEEATLVDIGPVAEGVSAVVAQTTDVFAIGGGTERVQPLIGGLAAIVLVASVYAVRNWLAAEPRVEFLVLRRFIPIVVFGGYVVLITVMDAVSSGAAPHYGALKIGFALAVMITAACVPLAGMVLSLGAAGMTALRWAGVLVVLLLLTWDSLLPRAINAISPTRWVGIDQSSPSYWSAAEVRATAEQPLSSLPVACVVAPPHAPQPSALPWGQETYSCTRLLLGMNGLEGATSFTNSWLGTEWTQQRSIWSEVYSSMPEWTAAVSTRPVIVVDQDARLAGFTTFSDLIRSNPPRS